MSHYTWTDIFDFVKEHYSQLGGSPNGKLFRMLGNQALRLISEATQCYRTHWDNVAVTGALTISTNSVTLPIDCISVERVEWDGADNPLGRMSESDLDVRHNGWRENTGNPTHYTVLDAHTLMLNSAPSGSVAGKLVVRGVAYLPDFSDVALAQNPLEFIPAGAQLAVAYYILANLPFVPAQPIADSQQAFMQAQNETARRQQMQAGFAQQFDTAMARTQASTNRKTRRSFSY